MRSARLWAVVLAVGLLGGCEDSDPPVNPVPDSGTVDSGTPDDGGTQVEVDAGTDAGSLGEPLPCEKTKGVCSGARRAVVDGAYEPVCTARSYGADYEASETRCDGLDNDCDGVTDPRASWSPVASLGLPPHAGRVDSLRVTNGVLAVVFDRAAMARVIHMDTSMAPLGITEVPVEVVDENLALDSVSTRLLRTAQGPALYYASAGPAHDRTRGHLILLDEQGHRVPRQGEPEGGALLFDQPVGDRATAAAVSADGTRVFAAWRDASSSVPGGRWLYGTLTGLDGQVVVAPRALMVSRSTKTALYGVKVLGLRDGGFLVMARESKDGDFAVTLRLQRLDAALQPVGDEWSLYREVNPDAQLVDLGEAGGNALESPALVMRTPLGDAHMLTVHRDLFGKATHYYLSVVTPGEVAWVGTAATSRGLQAAWLSAYSDPRATDPFIKELGRFWALEGGDTPKDLSPGPDYLRLHVYSRWVQLEELPDRWMGALVTTSTVSPVSHTLQAVRYCSP